MVEYTDADEVLNRLIETKRKLRYEKEARIIKRDGNPYGFKDINDEESR